MVLFIEYGKWFLGGGDDGAGNINSRVYYTIKTVWKAEDAV